MREEERLTVERGIHSADVDQETHHGHALGGLSVTQQLVPKDLAGLATSRHGVDVEIGKGLHADAIRIVGVGEDLLVVVEDCSQEVVLDIHPPQGLAVFLFQVSDLANVLLPVGIFALRPLAFTPIWLVGRVGVIVGHSGVFIFRDGARSERLALLGGGRAGRLDV